MPWLKFRANWSDHEDDWQFLYLPVPPTKEDIGDVYAKLNDAYTTYTNYRGGIVVMAKNREVPEQAIRDRIKLAEDNVEYEQLVRRQLLNELLSEQIENLDPYSLNWSSA